MEYKKQLDSFRKLTAHFSRSKWVFRIFGSIVLLSAINYFLWRYTQSMNTHALWFAIPLLIAETYGFFDLCFFLMLIWHPLKRVSPEWDEKPSVDIFITTYNESPELLQKTAAAVSAIDWVNKHPYILDDGNRPEVRALAEKYSCGYIVRGPEWTGKQRYAKAGNVNNALMQTTGDFILILDADQIPAKSILKKTIGYFKDPEVAFVQTPQFFYNIPRGNPFGSDASLFYGPIMQGKDGWNAAFFCGSNAILRRESLMQVGLIRYVQNTQFRMAATMNTLRIHLKQLNLRDKEKQIQIKKLLREIKTTKRMLKTGTPLEVCSDYLNDKVRKTLTAVSSSGLDDIYTQLSQMAGSDDPNITAALSAITESTSTINELGHDSGILDISGNILAELNLESPNEAQPLQPMVTESITEDMATALLLHSHGWKSVYHPEILAGGLAPEDLKTALGQRLRWAQGTIQVLRKENPFKLPGLSPAQRLMYFNTIWTYFSGFFNLILILSPLVFLYFNIAPIKNWSKLFFMNFIPFFVLNKILFRIVALGSPMWRGEQYSTALFPLWIEAVLSVYTGRHLSFKVTPKDRQGGTYLPLVIPQLLIMTATIAGIIFYSVYWLRTGQGSLLGFGVNGFWGVYNISLLSGIIRAAFFNPEKKINKTKEN